MVKKRNKKIKNLTKLIIFLIIIFFGYNNQEIILDTGNKILNYQDYISTNNNQNKTQQNIETIYNLNQSLNSDITPVFCPSQGCFNIYNQAFLDAKEEIKCAFYELDEENLTNTLLSKSKSTNINISLIVDNNYLEEKNLQKLFNTSIKIYSDIDRQTRYNNYMHNKFCIIDNNILILGSANPTLNGFYKNNNNILKIESSYLAKNFENEFDTMSNNIFGTNKKSSLAYNNLTLNYQNETYLISSYMCPQDNCDKIILEYLDKSEQEILFASFTLTHDEISSKLIEKSNNKINVEGLIEARNWNLKGSDTTLMNNSFPIIKDTNKNNMHHKFFVIDNKYVITGSMNPTNAGANYNDEFILVIENPKIAKLYKQEYQKLTNFKILKFK